MENSSILFPPPPTLSLFLHFFLSLPFIFYCLIYETHGNEDRRKKPIPIREYAERLLSLVSCIGFYGLFSRASS